MTIRVFLGLTLALALAGCGAQTVALQSQQAATGLKARSTESFFPADPAMVWQYEITAHPAGEPGNDYHGVETVTVDSVRRDGDKTIMRLRSVDDFTNQIRFPVLTESADGVTMQGVTYWGMGAEVANDLTIQFLQFPLKVGARWDDGQWIGKAIRKETVKVPAGTFEAWNIDVIGTYDHEYTAVGHYWVAPGKGIVKSVLSLPGWDMESVMIPAGKQPTAGRATRLPGQ